MKAKQIQEIVAAIVSIAIKVIVIIWLANFIYAKAIVAYDFGYRVFAEEPVSPAPGRDVTVAVTEGKTEKAIAESLYEKGLVRDEKLAWIQIFLSDYKDELIPGVYTLNTSQTVEEMMAVMAGKTEEPLEDEEES